MELRSQAVRKLAPENDPLKIGMGWKVDDLAKPQIMVESTFGDSHPGSAHLDQFVKEAVPVSYTHLFQRRVQNIVVDLILHLFGKEFVFQMGKFAHGCSLPCFLIYYKAGQQTKARAVLIHRQPLLLGILFVRGLFQLRFLCGGFGLLLLLVL